MLPLAPAPSKWGKWGVAPYYNIWIFYIFLHAQKPVVKVQHVSPHFRYLKTSANKGGICPTFRKQANLIWMAGGLY